MPKPDLIGDAVAANIFQIVNDRTPETGLGSIQHVIVDPVSVLEQLKAVIAASDATLPDSWSHSDKGDVR